MKKTTKTLLCGFMAAVMLSAIPGSTGNAKEEIPGWTNNGYGWWYDLGNGTYLADGKYPIGYDYYYFDASGYMQTGWVYEDGFWIYFEPGKGNQANSKWIGDYYVDMSGRMITSRRVKWDDEFAGEYYVDSTGKYCPDQWYSYPAGWSLYLGEGSWLRNGLYRENGKMYAFDENGYMITDSWFNYETPAYGNVWFYAGSSGELLKNQWLGDYYLTDDGTMAVDEYIDNYYIDENGHYEPGKVQGWVYDNDCWKFITKDGPIPATRDDIQIDNKYYAFHTGGRMTTGMVAGYLNSETGMVANDYFKESGERAVDEWVYFNGIWYYANPRTADYTSMCVMNGKPYWVSPGYYCDKLGHWVPGPHMPGIEEEMYPMVDYEPEINVQAQGKWVLDSYGWWFNYDEGGYPYNKFEKIGGQTYYFDEHGYMVTGWYYKEGEWYYFDEKGHMASDWTWVDDKCYYLDTKNGVMAKDTYIDGYYVNGSGAWEP